MRGQRSTVMGRGEEGQRLGLAPWANLLQSPRLLSSKQCTVIEEKAEMKSYSGLG
jgi:hypothetical protein